MYLGIEAYSLATSINSTRLLKPALGESIHDDNSQHEDITVKTSGGALVVHRLTGRVVAIWCTATRKRVYA